MKKIITLIIIIFFFIIYFIYDYKYKNTIIDEGKYIVQIKEEKEFEDFKNDPLDYQNKEKINSIGNGFIIDKRGLVITNKHVLNCKYKSCENKIFEIINYKNDLFLGKVIYISKDEDIGLIKIINSKKDFDFIKIDNKINYNIGDNIESISLINGKIIKTNGKILNKNKEIKELNIKSAIELNINISNGYSGSPIIKDSKVIGIITAKSKVKENIGFAIKINSDLIYKLKRLGFE